MTYSFSHGAHKAVREHPTWTVDRLVERVLADMPGEAREAALRDLVHRAIRSIHYHHVMHLAAKGSPSGNPRGE